MVVFMKTNLQDKTGQDGVGPGAKRGKAMQITSLIQVTGTQRGINATLRPLLSGAVLRKMTHGGRIKGK